MTKTIEPKTLPGFRDFLPEEARKRQWLKEQMVRVFERWGYEPLETPTLEPLEIFQGQIGEDEKLFFKFTDQGGRDVALRYDQTVPSCRVIGQYADKLVFPFRRYQIQSTFRAEKPQKGRYREFTQADIDIFGIASPLADAECIAVSIDLYRSLGFTRPIAIINNRDLLTGIPYPAIAAIDKLKKIGEEGVIDEMINKGFPRATAKEYLDKVKNLKPNADLETIFRYLRDSGISEEFYRFEPTLARSFSYSQGPIWEMIIEGYSTSSFGGSVGGGERYDNLVKTVSGKDIPATGIAFGFDRTLEALEFLNLLPKFGPAAKTLITVFTPELMTKSLEMAGLLRQKGVNAEVYPGEAIKLDKQLKYSDNKGIPFAVIIGPDEAAKGLVTIKNLRTKTQTTTTIENGIKEITSQ
jgi:histidyl-tRNA synthetase